MQYLLALLPLLATAFASPIKRANNQLIQSQANKLCLTPTPGVEVTNDTPLIEIDCSRAQGWDISPGSGSVILSGTGFALDAGSNPSNNGPAKLYQSYPGAPQQTWYLTDDGRIAITGGDQCLDVGENGQPKTTTCASGNGNQAWTVYDKGSQPSPTPSASASASSTSSSAPTPTGILDNVPRGQTYQDPRPGNGRRLHPYGRADLCVAVQGGAVTQGAAVDVSYCVSNDDPNVSSELWDVRNSVRGDVTIHADSGLCLDAGNNPVEAGARLKLWSCGDLWPQQTWTYSGTNLLSLDNGQCLTVSEGSESGSQAILQTSQCDFSAGNKNQVFFQEPYPNK